MADKDDILSNVAKQLASIVAEQIKNKIMLVIGVDNELRALPAQLNTIRNVLHDAEIRQFKEIAVEGWLRRLEQTSYEMEDVLEEWNYALLQRKMESESPDFMQKVCSFISFVCLCFKKTVVRHDIAMKIQDLKSRLDEIVREMGSYNFVVSHHKNDLPSSSWRVQSHSLIDLEQIQGRYKEKYILVRKLTASGGSHEGLGYQILSIVGAGGLGKTTLAQLVYNDSQVKDCFDLRVWLCVSDPFDVIAIAKGIIESVTNNDSLITNQLNVILKILEENISGKKILLVLDDVWNEQDAKWEPLAKVLKCVGAGSKILVTSRKEKVAIIMGTTNEDIHRPKLLSKEDCWLLLKRSALTERTEEEYGDLHEIGKHIAKKCNGLPLAAKALGSLLRFKYTVEEWENVLTSEMWGLEHVEVELFPHLFLSYQDLSLRLRRCFSYCAFFPKDEKLIVEQLIRIWMALGYLSSNISSVGDNMELRGREYFQDIAMRSLFQEFKKDHYKQIVSCKMHDIVHDFAQFLRKRNKARVEASGVTTVTCQVCDPNLVSRVIEFRTLFWDKQNILNFCDCLTSLRVLRLSRMPRGIPIGMEKLIHLRWLDISGHRLFKEDLKTICELYFLQTLILRTCSIMEIPAKIRNLVQLRYLDLSSNRELKELTKSMCSLVELQTLLLRDCSLIRIPTEIRNLVQLRYLDLSWNQALTKLPESMCSLVELQTLNISYNKPLGSLLEEINSVQHPISRMDDHPPGHLYPQGLGQLSGLRTVSVLRGGSGCDKLGLLKNLNRLTGKLKLIIEVNSTSNPEELIKDAREAELKKKIRIQELLIKFIVNGESEMVISLAMGMIEALEPSEKLKKLEIMFYMGLKLPHWISSPLNQLRYIRLCYCKYMSSLPAVGKLQFLEELYIDWLIEMKAVGREWLGIREGIVDIGLSSATETLVVFPSLKTLCFSSCYKWEQWEDITAEEEESTALQFMPSLTNLTIMYCNGLKMLPHRLLRKTGSLNVLDIRYSSQLEKCYGDKDGVPWRSISQKNPQLQLRLEEV